MKKIIAALSLLITVSAFAEPVFLFPNCNFSPSQGQCTTFNTSGRTITCNIQMNGYTKEGHYLSGFDYITLYQGMIGWSYVYNYNDSTKDPISTLSATAFCNTIN